MSVVEGKTPVENDNAHWEGAADEPHTPTASTTPLFEWPYPDEGHGEEAHEK